VQTRGAISDADYPSSAQRNEESGTSIARFTIGTDGRVTDCNASGASATLDATTCRLIISRFKFKPATSGGSPVSSSKTVRITWRLPKD
jgi:periplasmic protein TonB